MGYASLLNPAGVNIRADISLRFLIEKAEGRGAQEFEIAELQLWAQQGKLQP